MNNNVVAILSEPPLAEGQEEAFFREFVRQWESGTALDEMVVELRSYFGIEVRSAGHLNAVVLGLVRGKVAPEWFREWWDRDRATRRNRVPPKPCPPPSHPLLAAPEVAPVSELVPVVAAERAREPLPEPVAAPEPVPALAVAKPASAPPGLDVGRALYMLAAAGVLPEPAAWSMFVTFCLGRRA